MGPSASRASSAGLQRLEQAQCDRQLVAGILIFSFVFGGLFRSFLVGRPRAASGCRSVPRCWIGLAASGTKSNGGGATSIGFRSAAADWSALFLDRRAAQGTRDVRSCERRRGRRPTGPGPRNVTARGPAGIPERILARIPRRCSAWSSINRREQPVRAGERKNSVKLGTPIMIIMMMIRLNWSPEQSLEHPIKNPRSFFVKKRHDRVRAIKTK